jgi:hypothetical protein
MHDHGGKGLKFVEFFNACLKMIENISQYLSREIENMSLFEDCFEYRFSICLISFKSNLQICRIYLLEFKESYGITH